MAGVVHISEEEAARDFIGLFERVRAGEQVIVASPGRRGVMMVADEPARESKAAPLTTNRSEGRTAADILDKLAKWEAVHGVLTIDEGFAIDVQAAHNRLNTPLDPTKWG